MKICPRCGLIHSDDKEVCRLCGSPLPEPYQGLEGDSSANFASRGKASDPANVLGIISIVLGFLSIVLDSLYIVPLPTFFGGLITLILAIIGKMLDKHQHHRVVLNIGFILGLFLTIGCGIILLPSRCSS